MPKESAASILLKQKLLRLETVIVQTSKSKEKAKPLGRKIRRPDDQAMFWVG